MRFEHLKAKDLIVTSNDDTLIQTLVLKTSADMVKSIENSGMYRVLRTSVRQGVLARSYILHTRWYKPGEMKFAMRHQDLKVFRADSVQHLIYHRDSTGKVLVDLTNATEALINDSR